MRDRSIAKKEATMPLQLHLPLDSDTRYLRADAQTVAALRDLQGNILRPHGRWHAAHWFLKFDRGRRGDVRALVARLAEEVSSAKGQAERAEAAGDESLVGLWLSAKGFGALGEELPADVAFQQGMRGRSSETGDTRTEAWEDHLKDPDAVLLIAGDSDDSIDRTRRRLLPGDRPDGIESMKEERGRELVPKGKPRVEPFGFREGISNPEMVGPARGWSPDDASSPLFPLKQVLTPYKTGYGSYVVFRKLEQDVDKFEANVRRLAQAIGPTGSNPSAKDIEYAAALVMGRFKSGTDLLVRDNDDGTQAPLGSSYHKLDSTGSKCPYQAHVRRANRRGELPVADQVRRSRLIVRRGIPYRQAVVSAASGGETKEKTGTLFICCQGSIVAQFELVQRYWLNDPRRMDALAGLGNRDEQLWPKTWNGDERVSFSFQSCVAVKGGEYFFAPPISFLKGLAGV
jgi:Dyp-type peroxidase family